jgi:poly(3-hydroxybutyrate) depolymerase
VLEEVRKRFRVDEDRVYLTGHSMGGTGAAYLALHHPDRFAAVAPLAAAYSFPWLARNATTLPFLWIGGALDDDYYHRGVGAGIERMRKFGVPVLVEVLPDEGHYGPAQDFDRIFAWLLRHRRAPTPRSFFFETDTPLHGGPGGRRWKRSPGRGAWPPLRPKRPRDSRCASRRPTWPSLPSRPIRSCSTPWTPSRWSSPGTPCSRAGSAAMPRFA